MSVDKTSDGVFKTKDAAIAHDVLLSSLHKEALSLREQYAKPRRSAAWDIGECEIVRFWANDGNCYGLMFHHLGLSVYLSDRRGLMINCAFGTILITGERVLDFWDDLCTRKVSAVRVDGKDITSIALQVRSEKD